jgi:sterol desaturase/sphingolipid hydroxylase (fatty acid hydroxylase superfamily)
MKRIGLAPSSGKTARRRLARSTWRARVAPLALAAAILVAIAAAAHLPPVAAYDDPAEPALALRLFAALQRFLAGLYHDTAVWILVAMLMAGLALEKLVPARRQPMANAALNVPYALLALLVVAALLPYKLFVAESVGGLAGERKLFDLAFETHGRLPLALAAMLVTALVLDFFFYWFHRLQHANAVLWQAHLLHHSDTALNVTTTDRNHVLDQLLTPFFIVAPMVLFFDLPAADIVLVGILPALWSNVVHMNVRVGFGKAWWLVTSPQYHRIHHSILPEHRDRNFAVWFPVWDILFGTAWRPRAGEYPPTGVDGVAVTTLTGALLLPFVRWYDMAARAWRGRAS